MKVIDRFIEMAGLSRGEGIVECFLNGVDA